MKNKYFNRTIGLILLSIPIIYYSCGTADNNTKMALATQMNSPSCECYSNSALDSIPLFFNKSVPGDLQSFNSQSNADCFAWQEFIALNWPANASVSFGKPMDTSPVQWETYMLLEVMFPENGAKPAAWGTLVSDKYAQKFGSQKLIFSKQKTKLLTFTAKFSGSDTLNDMQFGQAAPFDGPNWLGAQNGTNLWYEVMLNKDYYDFVVTNGYYNAITQHDSTKAGVPINFPSGVFEGATGAIELKAAWMEVDSISSPKWNRYKLSLATVLDPTTNQLRNTTVALVGLHILHKTTNQPTWVWATFEQVDNVPNGTAPAPAFGYNLFNSKCVTQKVTYKTAKGDTTVLVNCTPNVPPAYYLASAKPVPIQITRTNQIDGQDAAPINKRMQGYIQQFFPNSIWQYYQLVDVIWSQQPKPNPTKPVQAPQIPQSMLSGANIVANTTLESYVQSTNTCYSCHQFSNIANYPLDTANNNVFGDFSFAISHASFPRNLLKKTK
jgi:hypothetical protein